MCSRDETILQYIDILQYLLQQHNTIQLKGNINILHIAIYCNVCCLNVVNAQNPYSHMKCLFTKIQSTIAIWQYIALHLNTIHNMALTHIVSPLVCSRLSLSIHLAMPSLVYICITCSELCGLAMQTQNEQND